ncbi:hypothetical protein D9M72_335010 [compost metagenome]
MDQLLRRANPPRERQVSWSCPFLVQPEVEMPYHDDRPQRVAYHSAVFPADGHLLPAPLSVAGGHRTIAARLLRMAPQVVQQFLNMTCPVRRAIAWPQGAEAGTHAQTSPFGLLAVADDCSQRPCPYQPGQPPTSARNRSESPYLIQSQRHRPTQRAQSHGRQGMPARTPFPRSHE